MTVFDRVKNLCNEKGIKVSELERILGVGKNASYKWKEYNPASDTLFKISEYFGVSTDYILTGEENGISIERLHTDPEIIELVNEVARIPEAKLFLSAIKDMPKEDLETITSLVKKMTGNR